eukprot:TRINITY_DN12955_c0_g1_i1.p1 TRINITY_DN12955_c0_g1~~TRINITY_DN12955_c0_g1_i1.p1  ORF type:complete len:289 (+),score=110.23 TRINITY_DN12955_c0_g1_i1:45-869(+)
MATATGTTSAGKTGATSQLGSAGLIHRLTNLRFLRTLTKTLSMRANPGFAGGPNRHIRFFAKWGFWVYASTLPTSLMLIYKVPEWNMRLFTNGDERWKNCPTPITNNRAARPLTWDPQFIYGDDPWVVYKECYNQIPWEQTTKFDDPDIERGWNAFGADSMGQATTPMGTNHIQQRMKPYNIMVQMDDYTNYFSYYMWGMLDAFKLYGKDVYYNYYHVFFHVPLDERNESLGQNKGIGRRIMRRHNLSGGVGAHHYLDWLQGGITFLQAPTFFG